MIDAEKQVSYVDREDTGAAKQASMKLAALVETRDGALGAVTIHPLATRNPDRI
ncbi:hypothetical protein [Falsiroseomonas sp.]|uniref:hypothetical protein n=1 Tax=Falsiroseomonas sp. TaxID=2870721 RepID=UPI0034A23AA9